MSAMKSGRSSRPLALKRKGAEQCAHDLREVVNGLRYIAEPGSLWRWLLNDPPPWTAVNQQTQHWLAEKGRRWWTICAPCCDWQQVTTRIVIDDQKGTRQGVGIGSAGRRGRCTGPADARNRSATMAPTFMKQGMQLHWVGLIRTPVQISSTTLRFSLYRSPSGPQSERPAGWPNPWQRLAYVSL